MNSSSRTHPRSLLTTAVYLYYLLLSSRCIKVGGGLLFDAAHMLLSYDTQTAVICWCVLCTLPSLSIVCSSRAPCTHRTYHHTTAAYFEVHAVIYIALYRIFQENVGNLRAKAFEAKRWVLLKLDSLGQAPDLDSDCDCDLESG